MICRAMRQAPYHDKVLANGCRNIIWLLEKGAEENRVAFLEAGVIEILSLAVRDHGRPNNGSLGGVTMDEIYPVAPLAVYSLRIYCKIKHGGAIAAMVRCGVAEHIDRLLQVRT